MLTDFIIPEWCLAPIIINLILWLIVILYLPNYFYIFNLSFFLIESYLFSSILLLLYKHELTDIYFILLVIIWYYHYLFFAEIIPVGPSGCFFSWASFFFWHDLILFGRILDFWHHKVFLPFVFSLKHLWNHVLL